VARPRTYLNRHRKDVNDKAIDSWLDKYQPDHLAVERMLAQNNTPTIIGTAQASGVAIAAGARRNVPTALLTPSEVKAAVTGSGTADKQQGTAIVMRIISLQSE